MPAIGPDARLTIDDLRKGRARGVVALIRTHGHEGRGADLTSADRRPMQLRLAVICERGLVALHARAGAAGKDESEQGRRWHARALSDRSDYEAGNTRSDPVADHCSAWQIALAAALFDQLRLRDHDVVRQRLAHVVDRSAATLAPVSASISTPVLWWTDTVQRIDRIVAVHVDRELAVLDAERMTERNQLVRALRRHHAGNDRGLKHRPLRRVEPCARNASATSCGNRTRVCAVAVRFVTALSPTSTMVGRVAESMWVKEDMGCWATGLAGWVREENSCELIGCDTGRALLVLLWPAAQRAQ